MRIKTGEKIPSHAFQSAKENKRCATEVLFLILHYIFFLAGFKQPMYFCLHCSLLLCCIDHSATSFPSFPSSVLPVQIALLSATFDSSCEYESFALFPFLEFATGTLCTRTKFYSNYLCMHFNCTEVKLRFKSFDYQNECKCPNFLLTF